MNIDSGKYLKTAIKDNLIKIVHVRITHNKNSAVSI
jgi:hypothetical protein